MYNTARYTVSELDTEQRSMSIGTQPQTKLVRAELERNQKQFFWVFREGGVGVQSGMRKSKVSFEH